VRLGLGLAERIGGRFDVRDSNGSVDEGRWRATLYDSELTVCAVLSDSLRGMRRREKGNNHRMGDPGSFVQVGSDPTSKARQDSGIPSSFGMFQRTSISGPNMSLSKQETEKAIGRN